MGTYQLLILVQRLFDIYGWLIIAWCLMSWIPMRPGAFLDDLRGALGMLVEPYLNLFRRLPSRRSRAWTGRRLWRYWS